MDNTNFAQKQEDKEIRCDVSDALRIKSDMCVAFDAEVRVARAGRRARRHCAADAERKNRGRSHLGFRKSFGTHVTLAKAVEANPMRLIQKAKQRTIARNALMLLAVMTLSIAAATDGVAAGRSGRGGGGFRGGHIGGGFRGPLLNSVPAMQPPVYNPSSPYTVPASPEIPVSPASPGSVFGNG